MHTDCWHTAMRTKGCKLESQRCTVAGQQPAFSVTHNGGNFTSNGDVRPAEVDERCRGRQDNRVRKVSFVVENRHINAQGPYFLSRGNTQAFGVQRTALAQRLLESSRQGCLQR